MLPAKHAVVQVLASLWESRRGECGIAGLRRVGLDWSWSDRTRSDRTGTDWIGLV